MSVRREIEVEASPDEVWEAIATSEGRDRWLDEAAHSIVVESAERPHRLVWWWWDDDAAASEPTRVEFLVVAAPAGSRVVVIESRPVVPTARLAMALTPALA